MSYRRYLILSFLIGACGLAIFSFLTRDFILPIGRSVASILISSVIAGLGYAARARWASGRRPPDEDATSWRRHDAIWQVTTLGLLIVLVFGLAKLAFLASRPGS